MLLNELLAWWRGALHLAETGKGGPSMIAPAQANDSVLNLGKLFIFTEYKKDKIVI